MEGMEQRVRDRARVRLAAEVAGYALDVPAEQILDLRRGGPPVTFARHVAFYLSHIALQMSLARIAFVTGRDRATIAYAVRTIEDRRDTPHFDLWIDSLETMLRHAPAPTRRDRSAGAS